MDIKDICFSCLISREFFTQGYVKMEKKSFVSAPGLKGLLCYILTWANKNPQISLMEQGIQFKISFLTNLLGCY